VPPKRWTQKDGQSFDNAMVLDYNNDLATIKIAKTFFVSPVHSLI